MLARDLLLIFSILNVFLFVDARPLGAYLTYPIPRQRTYEGCKIGGPAVAPVMCAGPCEASYTPYQANYTVARGDKVKLQWPRNSHAGGFIRLAWIEREPGVIETHQMFDENVHEYGCFETTCWADQNLNGTGGNKGSMGGDNNDPDGLINPCTFEATVPLHLNDGLHVMQWAWYGGGGGYNGDYYSCVNFIINGGATGDQIQPTFTGGDVSDPQYCKHWSTDRLHFCDTEPCTSYCTNATSPIGSCGVARFAVPYIDPFAVEVNTTTNSSSSSGPIATSTVDPFDGTSSMLTVYFPIDPAEFDVIKFVYDMANILNINKEAFTKISVRLDLSKLLATVVEITVANVVNATTGAPIDPVKVTDTISNWITTQPDALVEAFYVSEMRAFDPAEFPSQFLSSAQHLVPSAFIAFVTLFWIIFQ